MGELRGEAKANQKNLMWSGFGCLPLLVAGVIALVLGGVLAMIWPPLGYVGLALGIAAYFPVRWAELSAKKPVLRSCPHCRSFVPAGANVCRKCGRDIT